MLRSPFRTVLLVSLALASAGCEDDFSPILPSSLSYSVFGYLDPAQDTQWIRVTPLRPLAVTVAEPSDVQVTLERIGTAEVIALRDSIFAFTFPTRNEIGSEGAFLHNFWTTEPIEPGATYRLIARREGQPPAEALIAVPPDFDPTMWFVAPPALGFDSLEVAGLENLPFLRLVSHYWDGCGVAEWPGKLDPADSHLEGRRVRVNPDSVPIRTGCGRPIVFRRELTIVGSGAVWPEGEAYSPYSLVPERASNVSNAVGFVAGILTKRIPYEKCEFVGGGPHPDYCAVSYDASRAILRGTVNEVGCGIAPLDSATVTLTESDPLPPSVRKIRTALSGPSGEYEVQGLEPGMRYALAVRGKTFPDPFFGRQDLHSRHTDTLTFAVGERREYDVDLEYLNPCGT